MISTSPVCRCPLFIQTSSNWQAHRVKWFGPLWISQGWPCGGLLFGGLHGPLGLCEQADLHKWLNFWSTSWLFCRPWHNVFDDMFQATRWSRAMSLLDPNNNILPEILRLSGCFRQALVALITYMMMLNLQPWCHWLLRLVVGQMVYGTRSSSELSMHQQVIVVWIPKLVPSHLWPSPLLPW